ncbi:MAG: GTPase [Planctomycetota bacterium]
MAATWSALTSPNARGAVTVIALESERLDQDLAQLGMGGVKVGDVRLRRILGVDDGLVARWSERRVDLHVHGGRGVLRALERALCDKGIRRSPEPRGFPGVEGVRGRVLEAIPNAASPRAIDLLLDQPRRWADIGSGEVETADACLDHLLTPPLVAAVGPPNIGKSTLLNALAGRSVALAADQPGTTRDHVGAALELDGLTVKYADLPGLDPSAVGIDDEAQRLAMRVVARADLVLLCSDRNREAPEIDVRPGTPLVRVGLRSDLGVPSGGVDVLVCAPERSGLGELASVVRRGLVPDEALSDPRPWRFWAS